MNTENREKETIIDENTSENIVNEIESATELTVEEKLQEDLANEKDKFLRLFAEFENFNRRTAKERIVLNKSILSFAVLRLKFSNSAKSRRNLSFSLAKSS